MRWLIHTLMLGVLLAACGEAGAQLDPRLGGLAPAVGGGGQVTFWAVLAGDPQLTGGRWIPVGLYPQEWEARAAVESLRRRGFQARWTVGVATPSELAQHAITVERGRSEIRRLLALEDRREDDFWRERRNRRDVVNDAGFDPRRRDVINNAGFDPRRRAVIDGAGFDPFRRAQIDNRGFQPASRDTMNRLGGRDPFGGSRPAQVQNQPAPNPAGRRGNFGTQGAAAAPNRGSFGTQGAAAPNRRGGFGTQPQR